MNRTPADDLAAQYGSPDPLQVRIDTHRLYSERAVSLDEEAARILTLELDESVLDAGCGTGAFLGHLRESGHTGPLVGLDRSAGMAATVAAHGLGGIVGDVQHLPFPSSSFDHVVARHMLYHVPDIDRALAECVRVARRALLLSTGAADSMPTLNRLLDDTARTFGYEPEPPVMARFSIENAAGFLNRLGAPWYETVIDNALVFDDPEPMLRYVVSCLPTYGIMPDSPGYTSAIERLRERAQAALNEAGGTVRDPKQVALYLVSVA